MFEWIEFFNNLSSSEKSNLEIFCQLREVKKWEIIFSEWDDATSMYIVKSWLLEAYSYEKILWTIWTWELIWEMALFWDHSKRSASVKCLEDWVLIVMLAFSIKELTSKHPDMLKKIKETISKRKKIKSI